MPIVDEVVKTINSEVVVYFSELDRRRLESFIKAYLKDLSDEEIISFYQYVISYYKQKGWRIRAGHFFTPKILKFKDCANVVVFDYYHRLYCRPFRLPSPPYDLAIRKYTRIAQALLSVQKLIYVPTMGLELENGLYVIAETGIGRDKEYGIIKDAYEYFVSERIGYRDEHPVWRGKPFWKAGVPKELFNTVIGALNYKETAVLVATHEGKFPKLEKDLEDFERKYSDWIEFLPEPRQSIVQLISLI